MGSDSAVCCGEVVILIVYICIYRISHIFDVLSSLYQDDESYDCNIGNFDARQKYHVRFNKWNCVLILKYMNL